LFHLLNETALT